MPGQGLTVAHKEIAGSKSPWTFTSSRSDVRVPREIELTDWSESNVTLAVQQLRGYPTAVLRGAGLVPNLTRYLPDRHPRFPNLYCTDVEVYGHSVPQDRQMRATTAYGVTDRYKKARIVATYAAPKWVVLSDDLAAAAGGEHTRFLEVRGKGNGDYLSLPLGNLWWSQGPATGNLFPAGVGKIIGYVELEWVWREIPREWVDAEYYQTVTGRVNDRAFLGLPRHTALFESVEYDDAFGPLGELLFDVRFHVKVNMEKWTKQLYYGDGQFYGCTRAPLNPTPPPTYVLPPPPYIADAGDAPPGVPLGECLYDETNFAELFTLKVQP